MQVFFTAQAKADIIYWRKKDKKLAAKIDKLIENVIVTPFSGIGKPESLRYDHSGRWSRRIDREHRIVYDVKKGKLTIHQCRFHY